VLKTQLEEEMTMSESKKLVDDGGPAFPRAPGSTDYESWSAHKGMTLLDYFAGQALVGMMQLEDWKDRVPTEIACWAYDQAEAMLAERTRRAEEPQR
jgi:hypothetical protein